MRPLEIFLPLLLVAYLLSRFFNIQSPQLARTLQALPLIATLVVLAHLAIEGYRWQMIPLYVLTAAFALHSLPALLDSTRPILPIRGWWAAGSVLTFIGLAVSTALPYVLPVVQLDTPSGPYQVGTQIFELTDASRKELYSGKDESRRFMIQVWYPSSPTAQDVHAPWMQDAHVYARAIAGDILELPPYFMDHLALSVTPAYKNSALTDAGKPFPVIIFSHGWNGFAAQNSNQMIQLASQGYVVIGVQHTYGAVITVFPDGTTAKNNPEALPESEGMTNEEYEPIARALVDQWADDLSYVVDQLNAGKLIPTEAVDLNRIGAYGHSTGGGAVIEFCGRDPRCIAVLGMDPFLRPISIDVLNSGLAQQTLLMFSEEWAGRTTSRNNELLGDLYPNLKNPLGIFVIAGAGHYDFSDLPLLTPLAPQLGLKGPIAGPRVVKIVNDYLIAFFNTTLKGEKFLLPLAPTDDYPELTWPTP